MTALSDLREAIHAPASNVLLFTGAGISRAAGLTPYRGPGGLAPLRTLQASLATSRQVHLLWDAVAPMLDTALRPTPAHETIASWTGQATVATQNIDSLHSAAGTQAPLHLHGSATRAVCLSPKCRSRTDAPAGQITELVAALDAGEDALARRLTPRCPECGARLRPDVTLFGERPAPEPLEAAFDAARQATVVLAAGTSLQVSPANFVLAEALAHGARVAWLESAPESMSADLPEVLRAMTLVRGDCQETLPQLLG